jgi:hypothetical protein
MPVGNGRQAAPKKNNYRRSKAVIVASLLGTAGLWSHLAGKHATPVYGAKNLVTKNIKGLLGYGGLGNREAGRQIARLRRQGTSVTIHTQPTSMFGHYNRPVSYSYPGPNAKVESWKRNWSKGLPLSNIPGLANWWTKGFVVVACAVAATTKSPYLSKLSFITCGTGGLAYSPFAADPRVQAIFSNVGVAWAAITADAKRAEKMKAEANDKLTAAGVSAAIKTSAAATRAANAEEAAAATAEAARIEAEAAHARALQQAKNAEEQRKRNAKAARNKAAENAKKARVLKMEEASRREREAKAAAKQRDEHHKEAMRIEKAKIAMQMLDQAQRLGIVSERAAVQLILATANEVDERLGVLLGAAAANAGAGAALNGGGAWNLPAIQAPRLGNNRNAAATRIAAARRGQLARRQAARLRTARQKSPRKNGNNGAAKKSPRKNGNNGAAKKSPRKNGNNGAAKKSPRNNGGNGASGSGLTLKQLRQM